jgi:shikimate dehydrogenase
LTGAAGGGRRCAVLGSPIGHSLSPVLHHAAYAELGLAWTYEAREVTERSLPGFLAGLDRSWRGLSLTMPLKRAVVPLLDAMTDRAEQAGAANTVILEGGRRTGHNTDVPGAASAVRERYAGPVDRAVVVGGGATAASVLLGLADLGCRHVTLVLRDHVRAAATLATAERHPGRPTVDVRPLGSALADVLEAADILVSTVPGDVQGAEVLALAQRVDVVFDVAYDPWPTPVARATRSTGALLVSGLDLLVHQAALQVELMTGTAPAPLEAMRLAGERALAVRGT